MTELEVTFAKIIFRIAGLWGVLTLTPLHLTFDQIGRQHPPAITHPDFYFGFVGLGSPGRWPSW